MPRDQDLSHRQTDTSNAARIANKNGSSTIIGNRHCPNCRAAAARQWLVEREASSAGSTLFSRLQYAPDRTFDAQAFHFQTKLKRTSKVALKIAGYRTCQITAIP
jgi:hypothetical protein